MIVIFEGPDGAGKSTLIKQLRQARSVTDVEHFGPYPGETSIGRHYLDALKRAHGADVFFDRSWLSESIYGVVYRGGDDRLGVAGRRMLDRVALGESACVVYCAPPFANCAQSFTAKKAHSAEYLDNLVQLRSVYDGYEATLGVLNRETSLPVVRYDYTSGETFDELWARVERARPPKNEGPGIGHFAPGTALLVGARMNSRPNVQNDRDLPFVSFNEGGCSMWLARGLALSGVPEAALYWVNATGLDGAPTSAGFIDALRPEKVVALGNDAEAWCKDNGLTYVKVLHPQAWKRFHANGDYPLYGLLQEVL